ncbi:MAG: hypothetical protein SP1CHLAM54_02240 [Chlamydiia bacterium]|nr:hypothetical protein [Chlamydiia bacterium]MCH9615141.1 hypothetical protein [Chlamydiia bacterium]MCH9628537.1 hypothetical protein [Chlamydiia bacterium]
MSVNNVNTETTAAKIARNPSVITRVLKLSTDLVKSIFSLDKDTLAIANDLKKNLDQTHSYIRLFLLAPGLLTALKNISHLKLSVSDWLDGGATTSSFNTLEKVQNVAVETLAPGVYDTSQALGYIHKIKAIDLTHLLPTLAVAGAIAGGLISAKNIADLGAEYFAGKGEHHMLRLVENVSALALSTFVFMPVAATTSLGVLSIYVATNVARNYFL